MGDLPLDHKGIKLIDTLLKGNDQSILTITLPLELAGECSPEG